MLSNVFRLVLMCSLEFAVGYKMVANTDPLYGVNREFLQLEVTKTTESFESKVSESGRREECEKKQVKSQRSAL